MTGGARRGHGLVTVAVVEAVAIGALLWALLDGGPAASAALPASHPPAAVPYAEPRALVAAEPSRPAPDPASDPKGAPAVAAEHAVLHGRVTGRGKPLPGWRLAVLAAGETKPLAESFLRDTSAYAVPALRPGRYEVRFTAEGFRARAETVDVPAGVDRVRLDAVLVPDWELRVLMLDADGRPLPETIAELRKEQSTWWRTTPHAMATDGPPPALLPSTTASYPDVGVGEWHATYEAARERGVRLPRRYSGYLALPEDRPLHVSAVMRTVVLATERVEAGQEEVVLRVSMEQLRRALGTVRLQLVDADGAAPVQGARVALNDAQSGGGGEPVDAEGRIELRLQRPGLLQLEASAPGRILPWWSVAIEPGATIDLGALAMVKPVPFTARLEGVPPDAQVSWSVLGLDPPPHAALRARTAHLGTRQDRTVTFSIAPGRYQLRARAAGAAAAVEFDTRELGASPLVVRLDPSAKLRVPARTTPLRVSVRDSGGRVVFENWLQAGPPFDLPLPVGEYTVEVMRLGAKGAEQRVRLDTGGADVDLR